MRGLLIAFEGLDGAGKTTLADAVVDALGATSLATPLARLRAVRDAVDRELACPDALTLWYGAHVAAVSARVDAILERGTDAVVDRYVASSIAWAIVRGASVDALSWTEAVRRPELAVFVDTDDATRARRIGARATVHEHDATSLLRASDLRAAYQRALRVSAAPVLKVDGGAPLKTQVRRVLDAIAVRRLMQSPMQESR